MIRPVTLIAFAAFIGSGLYLYQVKHQAQLVDRQIHKVQDATEAARARAGVLRAEYALLNDPDRLAQLATQYVPDLKSTQPSQWSSMAEIDRRLPPVGGPTATPAPLEPDAAPRPEPPPMASVAEPAAKPEPARAPARPAPAAVAAAPAPAPAPAAAPALAPVAPPPVLAAAPARPAPHTAIATARAAAQVAAAAARPVAPVNLAHGTPPTSLTLPAPATVAAPALVQVASAPPPRPAPGPSLLPRVSPPASAPAGASVFAVATRPLPPPDAYAAPPRTPAEAIARIARGGPVDPSVPVVASALGMARTMMTVSPVSPANAGTLYPQPVVTR